MSNLVQLRHIAAGGESVELSTLADLTQLESLSLGGSNALTDISPLAGLVKLTSLDLSSCERLENISPLAGLAGLNSLSLNSCERLVDLSPLAGLAGLDSLDLSYCKQVVDLTPLAALEKLTSLDLSSCERLENISPLAGLGGLMSLNLSRSERLNDVRALAEISGLLMLELCGCPLLTRVSALSSAPSLRKLSLSGSSNVRDLESLCQARALLALKFDQQALRDGVMLAIATRRHDPDLVERVDAMLTSFYASDIPDIHAARVVEALGGGVDTLPAAELTPVICKASSVFRERCDQARSDQDAISARTWERFFAVSLRVGDPLFRQAFSTALNALPVSEASRILAPALLGLSDAPQSAGPWALELGREALAPLENVPALARDIAPAAAVFFMAHGVDSDVDAWLERGSVRGFDTWRDRVLVALVGRALQSGNLGEARRLILEINTLQRADEARGKAAHYLAAKEQFRDAAAELDAMLSDALRATTAHDLLAERPHIAGDAQAALSLLLALDNEPEQLASVLAAIVTHAPDSELAKHLASTFAPPHDIGLSEAIEGVLGSTLVQERAPKKKLDALRVRFRADPGLSRRVLAMGTAALLEVEKVVDDEDAAEIANGIGGGAA